MRKVKTFEQDLRERLKDPEFQKAWNESEPEYLLSRQLIEKRLSLKMTQRDLAKKVKTSQAAICRIESMTANPSLSFLKRIASALEATLTVKIA